MRRQCDQQIFIHPTSVVDDNCIIGDDTRIWQFCNIMHDTKIGNKCNIGQGCFIETGVVLGNGVKVKNNVSLYTGVVCENDVFLGPNCVFTNVLNPRSFINRKEEFKSTYIECGATIGANATIVCGHRIGKYALVGAGTVVTKDVPPYALVIGNPGEVVGFVCECGETLDNNNGVHICSKCNKKYIDTLNGLKEVE